MGQAGRYELKYVIDEERAIAVADYCRAFLRPSVHNGEERPTRGHPVMSIYMDSPDFIFFRQAYFGHLNRIKLRIRCYDDHWERPAFFEIKRRVMDVICKDRAMLSREAVEFFLNSGWPNPATWPDPSRMVHGKRRLDVYYKFWSLCNAVKAQPMIYTSYLREIYEGENDEELRVTFDRHVSATPVQGLGLPSFVQGMGYEGHGMGKFTAPERAIPPRPDRWPYYLPFDGVVLELKYEERPPRWMYDMVRYFNLQRRFMCKYAACIDSMELQWGKLPLPEEEQRLVMIGYD